MKHPWRYFLCAFVGVLFMVTWVAFIIQNFSPLLIWPVPLVFGGGLFFFGGAMLLGVWWANK